MRERIKAAQTQLAGLLAERRNADASMNELMILIAHAVRGNPAFGENSVLYRALGFVPKNDRKSGLKRGARTAVENSTKDADAA